MDTRTIVIGRVGENAAAQVVWPGLLSKWRGLYGEGTVQLAVRRPLDKSPYPAMCEVSGDDVTWTVSAADTAQHGTGECELSYLVGDVVAKSQTWATMILRSLTGDEPGEPPEDPAKAWFTAIQSQIGDLDDLTTKAKDNLVAAINEAAKSGSGGGGSVEMRVDGGYIQYSTDGETWENLIAVADLKGNKGDPGTPGQDGYSPSASVTETDDGAEITITDKTGTTTATVKNGTSDLSLGISGASAGQMIRIRSVDADGTPTAWEAVDGGSTPVMYSVVLTLTNCAANNTAESVQAGAAYTTTLTADTGYTLGTPTVTMGGANITSTAWDASAGTVSILFVTGDVAITCTAAADADTSPVIAGTGQTLDAFGGIYDLSGVCYTAFYPLYSGATKLTLFVADTENISVGTGGKMQFWSDEAFVEYWSAFANKNKESSYTAPSGSTRFRTTLAENGVDDSYAYDNTGHIYFAGKNTKYYGMANIDGTPAGGDSVSTAAAVDNEVMALELSTGATVNPTAYTGLTSDYVTMVQTNYDAFMAEVLGDYNRIPLIVHTDQHGRIGADNPVLKLIGDLTDWYEVSKCVNLGDVVSDRFSAAALQAYLDAARDHIPLSRRLDVYGNHDVWDPDENKKYSVDQKRLSPYFKNIYARRHGNNGYFTVTDDYYNVKYLVISDLEYPDTNDSTRRMSTAQAEFLVTELGADDGYDIVLVSHVPLVMDDTVTSRDTSYTAYLETFLSDAAVNTSFLAMIAARKAKTSGSFADSEGVTHAYDFTGCRSELLMSLHGHTHFEAYKSITGSVTEFAFDWFDGNTFYFAYIDRVQKKFKCWKTEAGAAALEIDIN